MNTLSLLRNTALIAALFAPNAIAQRQGQPRPAQGANQANVQKPQGTPSRQAARQRAVTAQRNSAEWHMQRRGVALNMVREEHAYRTQIARIDRMQAIYRRQARLERVAQLDQLRERVQNRYRLRQEECQNALGEQDYQRLRDRIQDQTQVRDRDRLQDGDRLQDRDRDRDRTSAPENQ